MSMTITEFQNMAVIGIIIALIMNALGYIFLISKMKNQNPEENIIDLAQKAFRQSLRTILINSIIIIILTIIAIRTYLYPDVNLYTKVGAGIVLSMFLWAIVKGAYDTAARLIDIENNRNSKIISFLLNPVFFIGINFVIFSIAITIFLYDDSKTFENYQKTIGIVRDVRQEHNGSLENMTYVITVEYEVNNKIYTFKESIRDNSLYENCKINMGYNENDISQARIDTTASGLVYAAMFILFCMGILFLYVSIQITFGNIKLRKIWSGNGHNSYEMVENGTKRNKKDDSIIKRILSNNPTALILIGMGMIFVIFSSVFAYSVYEDSKVTIKNQQRTKGMVIDDRVEYYKDNDGKGHYDYRPIVKIHIDDKDYVFVDRHEYSQKRINEIVDVIYDEKYPYTAQMVYSTSMLVYVVNLVFFVIGIFLLSRGMKIIKSALHNNKRGNSL